MLATALVLTGCVRKWPAYYAPVWSPDGKKLCHAAARGDGKLTIREIEVASGKGAEVVAGRFPAPPVAMALSPQGDQVACAVMVSAKGQKPTLRVHILSPGGEGDRVAWEGPCERGVADLCWAPDGRSLVFAADAAGGGLLCRVPANGGHPELATGRASPVASDFADVRAPSVSPDGQRVAFVAQTRPNGLWSLYVAALDGGARKLAVPDLFACYEVGYWPAWSPRGDAVAYVAERYLSRGFAELWAWEPASGRRRSLAGTLAGACIAPAWSPRGDAVAFVRLPFGSGPEGPGSAGHPADIVAVDAKGENEQTLVADGLANLMPAWSPDGATVAFGTCGEPSSGEPHAVRLATVGGGAVRLAENSPEAQFLLAWAGAERGNGRQLAAAAAIAPQIRDAWLAGRAHALLAARYASQRQWSNAAAHAARAANSPRREERLQALQLLATAQMRIGDPNAALAALDRLLSQGGDESARLLRQCLAEGIEAAGQTEAQLAKGPTPALLVRLATLQLRDLGNPRKAVDLLFRVLKDLPTGPHLREVAPLLFASYEELGAQAASYRVLEWAAGLIGQAGLTRDQCILIAEAAAANGQAQAALRWLDRLPQEGADDAMAERMARVCLRAAEQLHGGEASSEALAACRRAAAGRHGPLAARASLEAGKLLAAAGDHWEASRCFLAALAPQAEPAVAREAIRLLTAGRIQRRDPLSYDIARVAQLVAFGYLDSGVGLGEELLAGLPKDDPRRAALRRHLAQGLEKLAQYHLARGSVAAARDVIGRWLRHASREDELARALVQLAALQKAAGERQALVETLSRLAIEFADRPEGADARRQLLRLDTDGRTRGLER